jgi:hypothetical protein
MDEKALAIKEQRDAVVAVDTKPVVKAIMSSYAECDEKQILPAFLFALHVFRQYNYWDHLLSVRLFGVSGWLDLEGIHGRSARDQV